MHPRLTKNQHIAFLKGLLASLQGLGSLPRSVEASKCFLTSKYPTEPTEVHPRLSKNQHIAFLKGLFASLQDLGSLPRSVEASKCSFTCKYPMEPTCNAQANCLNEVRMKVNEQNIKC